MAHNAEAPELMNAQEAATFLGMNEEVLRRLARAGRVPAGKLGREWRFSKRQLIEFVESGGTMAAEAQRRLTM